MVEKLNKGGMDDQSLDQILELASKPVLSPDFESRMMKLVVGEKRTTAEIVAFPKASKPSGWLVGLPLAACLMLGIWLGASGDFSDVLPTSSTTTNMASADQLSPSGVEDIESLGDLS